MIVKTFPSGPFETNAYLVIDETTKEAWIIDPAPESFSPLVKEISKAGVKPVAIILTHSHWDHFADCAKLKKEFNIPVFVHELDAKNVETPGSDGLPMFISIEPCKIDRYLKEGETLSLGDLKFEVIHTPGHCPGSVCLFEPDERVLFSGDTLFKGTIGNLSFPTAESDKMWISLEKLNRLPKETKVYPGHGSATTIGAENWLPNAKNLFN